MARIEGREGVRGERGKESERDETKKKIAEGGSGGVERERREWGQTEIAKVDRVRDKSAWMVVREER